LFHFSLLKRCQASCVALTTAVALMLQRNADVINKNGSFNIGVIIDTAYAEAVKVLPDDKAQVCLLFTYDYISFGPFIPAVWLFYAKLS